MAGEKRSSRNDPPKNFIAASVEKAQKAGGRRKSRKGGEAAPESTPEPEPAPVKERSGRGPLANLLGNAFLGLVLLSLLAIPGLVYFTDMGAKAKREVRSLIKAMGAGNQELETELNVSRERIEALEGQVSTLKAANAALAERQREPEPREEPAAPAPKPAAPAVEEPPVPKELPRQEYELTRLFNGVGVRTTLDLQAGGSATAERLRPEAYEFEMKLKLAVPKAHQSLAELASLNPRLPQILPDLEKLLTTGKVSPLFERLYNLKHERIKVFLTRLERLETRHNYYDCETMLELTHPGSGQKALLIQGEMDVVADGSDGDRLPEVSDYISLSTHYQPTTSFAWTKRSALPNPLLSRLEKELKEVVEEYAIKGLSPERNIYLRDRRDELQRYIADMKSRSYLIAETDPFIVLPLTSVLGQPGAPAIGDYAVVIHQDRAYPVICGDAGPSWKFGEASLMVAKTIEPNASPYSRPVSDLKVTYLIFPGSADAEKGPPDLARWRSRCRELLSGMGGLGEGMDLMDWRDHVAERNARRVAPGLVEAAKSKAAEAAQHAKTARVQATGKRKAAEDAAKRLQAAKSAPPPAATAPAPAPAPAASGAGASPGTSQPASPAPDLAKLEAQVQAAQSQAEEAALLAQAAEKAAQSAAGLIQQVEAAVAKVLEATGKPYHIPRAETTDVALPALAEAKQALAQIEAELGKTRAR